MRIPSEINLPLAFSATASWASAASTLFWRILPVSDVAWKPWLEYGMTKWAEFFIPFDKYVNHWVLSFLFNLSLRTLTFFFFGDGVFGGAMLKYSKVKKFQVGILREKTARNCSDSFPSLCTDQISEQCHKVGSEFVENNQLCILSLINLLCNIPFDVVE